MTGQKTILTKEQRAEIFRRIAAGETQSAVAKDFNVTRAAISLLKQRTANPERFAGKYDLKKRLSDEEIVTFKHALDHTLPQDHGLDVLGHAPVRLWTMERGYALTDKLFNKQPSVRMMKECMGEHLTRRPDSYLTPPDPPAPFDIRRLPPELAADKDFVKYVQSPIARQIAQREYELALEQYQQQLAEMEIRKAAQPLDPWLPPEMDDNEDPDTWSHPPSDVPPTPVPGQRLGKHAKSKGSPFTKPKRNKHKR